MVSHTPWASSQAEDGQARDLPGTHGRWGAQFLVKARLTGSPSGAVQLLVRQLLDAGAHVRYHGDFDTAGLALCARMAAVGVVPWRMTADDYRAALAAADADGVRLPVEPASPPTTPWDPALHDVFADERLIVHEERLLPGLLDG